MNQDENEYQQFVQTNLRRNYIGNFTHGMLGMTGFRLINAPTFLPAYLHMISGSNAIVGLGLALQQIGGIISPVVAGNQIEHREKVMPTAIWMGSLSRLAVLGIALSGWMLSGSALITSVLIFLFLFGLFMGAQRVVFSLLMAKVIPIKQRGRLQAWRNTAGGLIAALLAYAAGKYIIGENWLGNGYATTFLVAFILTSIGLFVLQALIREPVMPTQRKQTRFIERLREIPLMIAADPSYGWFLVMQMAATGARVATPFYILYIGQQMEIDGVILGLLSLAFLGADTLSNLIWGYLGDRKGFRLVLLLSLAIWTVSTLLLFYGSGMALIVFGFCGLGVAQAGYAMGTQTIVLEFGNRDDMPMRIATSTTAESVTATVSALLSGLMADQLGYGAVFGFSLALLIMALALLLLAVREPRVKAG